MIDYKLAYKPDIKCRPYIMFFLDKGVGEKV